MRRFQLVFACVVVLLLALPLFAHAQVQAEARASGLRYTFSDLTPTDGKPAGVTLLSTNEASLSIYMFNDRQDQLQMQSPKDSLTLSGQLLTDARAASFYEKGASLEDSASGASYAILRADLDSAYVQSVSSGPIVVIEVAPHTRISASLDVTLALSMQAPEGDERHLKGQLWASLLFWPAFTQQYIDETGAWVGDQTGRPYLLDDSVSKTLNVVYDNDSDSALIALLQYDIGGNGAAWTDAPLPVPEPASWSMLAAGLGLFAMKKRRARSSGNGVR